MYMDKLNQSCARVGKALGLQSKVILSKYDVLHNIFNIKRHLPLSIGAALGACKGRKCELDRDRLYGILGLLDETISNKVWIDYSITNNTELVMEKNARILASSGDSSIFLLL